MNEFINFLGNEQAVGSIQNLLLNSRLSHAILLCGEAGTGKTHLAGLIAKALNCKEADKPCGVCVSCKKIAKNIHPDINFTFYKDNKTYCVESIREIICDTYIKPNEARKKVYVLCDCDKMSVQAQNILLKTLEEPPKNVVFILTCENYYALLETVRSRVIRFNIESVSPKLCADRLKQIVDDISYDRCLEIANENMGNIGKSLEMIKSDNITDINTIAKKMYTAIATNNEFDLIALVASLNKDKSMIKKALSRLIIVNRDAILYSKKIPIKSLSAVKCDEFVKFLNYKRTVLLNCEIYDIINKLELNLNLNLYTTYICSKLFYVMNVC